MNKLLRIWQMMLVTTQNLWLTKERLKMVEFSWIVLQILLVIKVLLTVFVSVYRRMRIKHYFQVNFYQLFFYLSSKFLGFINLFLRQSIDKILYINWTGTSLVCDEDNETWTGFYLSLSFILQFSYVVSVVSFKTDVTISSYIMAKTPRSQ